MTYHGFMALAELDLLEILFRETADVVDRWVICESSQTFTSLPKPMHILGNRDRFSDWWGRVIHVAVYDAPRGLEKEAMDKWNRNCIMRGLKNVKQSDLCVIGDLDEIPRASAVAAYNPDDGIRSLRMAHYHYFLNLRSGNPWDRCVILPASALASGWTPVKLRYTEFPNPIPEGGWHFSSMGGADALAYKLASFAHQGCPWHADEVAGIRDGTWIRDGKAPVDVVPIDETFPKFVFENQVLMKSRGLIYEVPPKC